MMIKVMVEDVFGSFQFTSNWNSKQTKVFGLLLACQNMPRSPRSENRDDSQSKLQLKLGFDEIL